MKKTEEPKKKRRLGRRILCLLAALLIIWTAYSWYLVSGRGLLELEPCDIARDYVELRGAAHIHTTYSHDGHGSTEEVLAIAKEAGLDFIVITDHNHMGSRDLSRNQTGEKPVLVVGNELSTDAGHLLGYNLYTKRHIFPDAHRAAIDEVLKDGGIAVIAHPTRRKTPWKNPAAKGIDGIELMNFEDFIFSAPKLKILSMLPQAFINQRAAFAALIEYPSEGMKLWDTLSQRKKTVAFGGTDAHGPLFLGIPAYKYLLTTINIHIVAKRNPGKEFIKEFIHGALRRGNFYISVDCIAVSRHIDFRLSRNDLSTLLIGNRAGSIMEGDNLVFNASLPKGSIVNLVRNGKIIRKFHGNHFTYPVKEAGAYRAEIIIPKEFNPYGKDKLWAITNHIYIENRLTEQGKVK